MFCFQELNDDIEDHTSKAHSLSEACQRFCQLLPPGEERLELKGEISKTRRKMNELALESTKRREIFRKSVPLLRQYCEDRDKVIEWLDDIELKVEPFIDKYNKDDVLLQYGEEIEVNHFYCTSGIIQMFHITRATSFTGLFFEITIEEQKIITFLL